MILRNLTNIKTYVLILTLATAGCAPNNAPNTASNPPEQNTVQPSPQQSVTTDSTASSNENIPVTMPMLDALLADETTANQIKTSSQITDEQLQKLKDSARDAVLKLGEDANEDDARSTSASSKEAEKEIKQILGDKAPQFLTAVRNQLASAGESFSASTQPNAVPTDTRIVVNAPEYRMDVYQNGKLLKTYKVGIGYPEFPLPSGLRRATNIIFNPTWTPPDEPWVKGKFEPGKKVEAGSKDNPLGPIKIPIGLPSLIHGGKQPGRLGTFASHGCVGLTNSQVQDFAMTLAQLSGTSLSQSDITGYEKQKSDTKEVKLTNSVPVELRYETIVVEDGKLKILRDVYERGTDTEDNLRRTLEAAGVNFDSLPADLQQKIRSALSEMARDAHGNPVDENESDAKPKGNKSGKITYDAKGKKEISFDIPELKGKGYPLPVNLSSK